MTEEEWHVLKHRLALCMEPVLARTTDSGCTPTDLFALSEYGESCWCPCRLVGEKSIEVTKRDFKHGFLLTCFILHGNQMSM